MIPQPVAVRILAAWLDDAGGQALEACDEAMIRGLQPESTLEILRAGYELYHSPDWTPASEEDGEPEADETAAIEALTMSESDE